MITQYFVHLYILQGNELEGKQSVRWHLALLLWLVELSDWFVPCKTRNITSYNSPVWMLWLYFLHKWYNFCYTHILQKGEIALCLLSVIINATMYTKPSCGPFRNSDTAMITRRETSQVTWYSHQKGIKRLPESVIFVTTILSRSSRNVCTISNWFICRSTQTKKLVHEIIGWIKPQQWWVCIFCCIRVVKHSSRIMLNFILGHWFMLWHEYILEWFYLV
jgi:hypothetical protein